MKSALTSRISEFLDPAGALLVAVGRSRRVFTDRTRTVAGSRAHPTPRGSEDAMPPDQPARWTLTAEEAVRNAIGDLAAWL
jgi:hypothetical protein